MSDLIRIKRGNLADLPELMQGEFGWVMDKERLYIGGVNGNVALSKVDEFGVNVKLHGAVGDGVADDTTSIQAAHDYAISKGIRTLIFPSGDYRITATLNWNVNKIKIIGYGATIISDGASLAFNLVNDSTEANTAGLGHGIYGQSNLGMHGMKITWKSGANAVAMKFQGLTNEAGISMIQFMNCLIEFFPVGLDFYSHSWNTVFIGGAIRCHTCVRILNGGSDYFERIDFIGVTLGGAYGNNDKIFDIEAPNGTITVSDCSLDYSQKFAILKNSTRMVCSNTHFETFGDIKTQFGVYGENGYWFEVYDDGSLLTFDNCMFFPAPTLTDPIFLCDSTVKLGGIKFDKCFFNCPIDNASYGPNHTFYNLVDGTGRVEANKISFFSQGAHLNVSQMLNELPDGTFENAAHGFTFANGGVIGTDDNHTNGGSKSIKLVGTAAPASAMMDINGGKSGKMFTFSFWAKIPVGAEIYAQVKCMAADGTVLGYVFTQHVTSTNNVWTFCSLTAIDPIPTGTQKMTLQFDGYSGTSYIDDVVMNIL